MTKLRESGCVKKLVKSESVSSARTRPLSLPTTSSGWNDESELQMETNCFDDIFEFRSLFVTSTHALSCTSQGQIALAKLFSKTRIKEVEGTNSQS